MQTTIKCMKHAVDLHYPSVRLVFAGKSWDQPKVAGWCREMDRERSIPLLDYLVSFHVAIMTRRACDARDSTWDFIQMDSS